MMPDIDDALSRLAELAERAGAQDIAPEARALLERAREGRFYVACIGQFKRGKSTLLNALVGNPILPVGVVPVTAVPTIVRHGPPGARVQLIGGEWRIIPAGDLARYVSESENPGNRLGILAVEVFAPSPLLASGLCLVDTPGLGSVFEVNSAATRAFVPHIDAAVVVLGADPPIGSEELALIVAVAREAPELIIIFNKSDRTSAADRAEAASFTRRILESHLGRDYGPIHCISALAALTGDVDRRGDWLGLLAKIEQLTQLSGRRLAAAAAQRGFNRLVTRLMDRLNEERGALQRPRADTEARLLALEAWRVDASRSLRELGPLLSAHQSWLHRSFETRSAAAMATIRSEAEAALVAACEALPSRPRATLRRRAALLAQDIARRHVELWLESAEQDARAGYAEVAARFIEAGDALLRQLRESAGGLLPTLPAEIGASDELRDKRGFHFHELNRLAAPAASLAWLVDLAVPAGATRRRAIAAAVSLLEQLLEVNLSRVDADLNDRVLDTRRALEEMLRRLIHEAQSDAASALHRARAAQAAGGEAVAAAIDHLADIGARLDRLLHNRRP